MKFFKFVLTFLFLIVLSNNSYAGFGGDDGNGGTNDNPVPIDGGASLLVGAAAVYGARKLKKKKTE